MKPLIIDGSFGEGGGQIIRSSLALSMISGTPIEIHSIRAGRKNGGLRKQHLTSVNAAVEICNAEVTGNVMGSTRITFTPNAIKAGNYSFATGSAGSAFLVFQTIFPALMMQKEESHLVIQGGTHNLKAPPAEFIEHSFLGTMKKIGVDSSLKLNRYGFYPKGGGEVEITITPSKLNSADFTKLSPITKIIAEPVVVRKPRTVADSQADEIRGVLPQAEVISHFPKAVGPGNSVSVSVIRDNIRQVFTGFGKRNCSPEITARVVAQRAQTFSQADIFCDSHLTDQLMIPLLLAGGGKFTCPKPSLHATTNAEVIKVFTGKEILFSEIDSGKWLCEVPSL